MRTVIMIDGGAGRVIAAIPALERYVTSNPNEEVFIVLGGWDNLLWGNKILQNITYSMEFKGLFDLIIKDADKVITPEPYRHPRYFRQDISLSQAFDEILNHNVEHSEEDYPKLYPSLAEKHHAAKLIHDIKSPNKKKTIVIQPFGRGAAVLPNSDIIDEGHRSLSNKNYLILAKKLFEKYNTIFFGESTFFMDEDPSAKFECDLRVWSAIIQQSNYFVGVDSVGQHIARAHNKPGTVIFGSTCPINTSYPNFFNIWEKESIKKYTPIRISGLEESITNIYNHGSIDLSLEDIDNIYESIVKDIEEKV